jgi:hypothetical protein
MKEWKNVEAMPDAAVIEGEGRVRVYLSRPPGWEMGGRAVLGSACMVVPWARQHTETGIPM